MRLKSAERPVKDLDAYRFVVVYRSERRAADLEPCWRGWVEQVYPASQSGTRRFWFQDIAEISSLIAAAVPTSASSDDRAN